MMKRTSTNGRIPGQRVTGLEEELGFLEAWLKDEQAETQLVSISGIGGIGKSTLLAEIARRSRDASILTLWLDGRGELATSQSFLSSIEMSLESEYGRVRSPDIPLLAEHPQHPLTQWEQRILRESFIHKEQNRNQLAAAFHMSRTTFYRHTRTAIRHLSHVLASSLPGR